MASKPTKDKKLSVMRELFCLEYLKDPTNATEAAIRAGYAEKSAKVTACNMLKNPLIKARIASAMERRNHRVEIDADYVLERHRDIDQMDVLDIMDRNFVIKPLDEWPPIWRQMLSGVDISELFEGSGDERAVCGVLKKFRWPDKLKNLELMGRHTNVGAYRDMIDHNHKGEVTAITRTIVDPVGGQ